MLPVESFQRTIEKFVQIASAIELPFHLTGGSISSAYGEPRLTQDIDIVISPVMAKQSVGALEKIVDLSGFKTSKAAALPSRECANVRPERTRLAHERLGHNKLSK